MAEELSFKALQGTCGIQCFVLEHFKEAHLNHTSNLPIRDQPLHLCATAMAYSVPIDVLLIEKSVILIVFFRLLLALE